MGAVFAVLGTLQQLKTSFGAMRFIAHDAALLTSRAAVSRWGPAEHLDHLVKVARSVVERIASQPEPLPRAINLFGRLFLLVGVIPRGRIRAPERLEGRPSESAEIVAGIDDVEALVAALPQQVLERRAAVVPHPKFGGLTAAQALRFVVIHNRHHLRIVSEIGEAARRAT